MARYRKKPVVIEAYHWVESHSRHNSDEWPEWLRRADDSDASQPGAFFRLADKLLISTLEGNHEVGDGDWIIQGIAGELYPCKPEIFEATYEAVD